MTMAESKPQHTIDIRARTCYYKNRKCRHCQWAEHPDAEDFETYTIKDGSTEASY